MLYQEQSEGFAPPPTAASISPSQQSGENPILEAAAKTIDEVLRTKSKNPTTIAVAVSAAADAVSCSNRLNPTADASTAYDFILL